MPARGVCVGRKCGGSPRACTYVLRVVRISCQQVLSFAHAPWVSRVPRQGRCVRQWAQLPNSSCRSARHASRPSSRHQQRPKKRLPTSGQLLREHQRMVQPARNVQHAEPLVCKELHLTRLGNAAAAASPTYSAGSTTSRVPQHPATATRVPPKTQTSNVGAQCQQSRSSVSRGTPSRTTQPRQQAVTVEPASPCGCRKPPRRPSGRRSSTQRASARRQHTSARSIKSL